MKDSGEARRTAKSALYLALDLTENAIDGLPIPGAKGIFSGVISMLKQVDVSLRFSHPSLNQFRDCLSNRLPTQMPKHWMLYKGMLSACV